MVNRELLKKLNLRVVADECHLSYNILRNYSCGRKKDLEDWQKEIIEKWVKELL